MTDLKDPRFEEGRAMLFAGLRREHSFTDAIRSIPEQWRQFQELGVIPGQIGETTYGAVCASSLDRQVFEYMCAVEVKDFDGPHLLPAREGWEEVADYALSWATSHAMPGGPGQPTA